MDGVTLGVIAVGLGLKFVAALFAVFAIFFTIVWMDKKFAINIKGWLNDSSDVTKAIYLGLRFVGLCVLFGLIMS